MSRWQLLLNLGVLGLLAGSCADDGGSAGRDRDAIDVPEEPVSGVTEGCGSVRLTAYDASSGSGWCEFSIHHAELPEFVQRNLTLAIAEPYNGSSYGGDVGEACGECWQIDSIGGTEIVMVNNLCPIEGNPLCAGGHFHFDLSEEAAAALDAGGLDEAVARRVPCPVTGNIHAEIKDRNEWGYLRVAFINHRLPIRRAEFRAADGGEWFPVARSGGAWHVVDDGAPFAVDGPGAIFRLTSATGEVVEGTAVLTAGTSAGALFDTGAQFTGEEPAGGACEFVPPGDVFDEAWGGIDQVRWQPNPWGDASASVVHEGCADGSAACVRIADLEQWGGFHLYYRQAFPTATFSRLTLRLRAEAGTHELVVAPSADGERCAEVTTEVGTEWVAVDVDVAAACAAFSEINGVTVGNNGEPLDLLIDEVRFER